MGSLLKVFGTYAFDVEEKAAKDIAALAEKWASHIVLRTPSPDREGEPPSANRDWAGARQFFRSHRELEQRYVVKAMADLRQVIWAFVQSLGRAVLDEGLVEQRTRVQLDRLRSTVQSSSIEDIKREALSAVSELDSLIDLRKKQQRDRTDELCTKLQQLGTKLEEAEREVGTDPLTQLANRKTFDSELTRAAHLFNVVGQPAALLVVDVDHFKKVNDTYGHPAGDRVLQTLAHTMVMTFPRKSDCVARVGGEEFAVVLRDTKQVDAHRLAVRLLDAVRMLQIPVDGQTLEITVSIGVAQLGEREAPDAWFARADRALYAAKTGGRNRVVDAT